MHCGGGGGGYRKGYWKIKSHRKCIEILTTVFAHHIPFYFFILFYSLNSLRMNTLSQPISHVWKPIWWLRQYDQSKYCWLIDLYYVAVVLKAAPWLSTQPWSCKEPFPHNECILAGDFCFVLLSFLLLTKAFSTNSAPAYFQPSNSRKTKHGRGHTDEWMRESIFSSSEDVFDASQFAEEMYPSWKLGTTSSNMGGPILWWLQSHSTMVLKWLPL